MNSFEFDAAKSESNRTKHGTDFVEAQGLWNDPMLLEIPAKIDDEPRYLVIGLIDCLIASLNVDTGAEAAWDKLADECEQELEVGAATTVPFDIAVARLEARFPG